MPLPIPPRHRQRYSFTAAALVALALAGCSKDKQQIELSNDSIGLRMTRSACPAVGVPESTGDVTLFDPAGSRAASAIDVVATLSDVRSQCADGGSGPLAATATFQVEARRTATVGERDVTLPYFATAMRGGGAVVAKQIGRIALHFAAGQATATTSGSAAITLDRAAVTLPPKIVQQISRRRKATDTDASIDPMGDPEVRAAISRASFELLVGFQLTPDQLSYNATR